MGFKGNAKVYSCKGKRRNDRRGSPVNSIEFPQNSRNETWQLRKCCRRKFSHVQLVGFARDNRPLSCQYIAQAYTGRAPVISQLKTPRRPRCVCKRRKFRRLRRPATRRPRISLSSIHCIRAGKLSRLRGNLIFFDVRFFAHN